MYHSRHCTVLGITAVASGTGREFIWGEIEDWCYGGLRVCDCRFGVFTLSCKLCGSRSGIGVGCTLMKLETSIIAGASSGFGVKPRSKVICLYSHQRYPKPTPIERTRSRSFSICILILYFEFKTDKRAIGQNFGIPLDRVSFDLNNQKRLT